MADVGHQTPLLQMQQHVWVTEVVVRSQPKVNFFHNQDLWHGSPMVNWQI